MKIPIEIPFRNDFLLSRVALPSNGPLFYAFAFYGRIDRDAKIIFVDRFPRAVSLNIHVVDGNVVKGKLFIISLAHVITALWAETML